jgi:hypothetical protein
MTDEERTAPVRLGDGTCEIERPLAILVVLKGVVDEKIWIPKSVLHPDSEVYDATSAGNAGAVVVYAWWATAQGRAPRTPERRPIPMKPPSKKWLKDQAARMARAKR